MIVTTEKGNSIDLSQGIDLSLPLSSLQNGPLAWNVNPPVFDPVKEGSWIGLVSKGASVNFRNVFFNPHGHGTHTECLGHITPEIHSVNKSLSKYFFQSVVISVQPQKKGDDEVIYGAQLEELISKYSSIEALIIRTLPNTEDKRIRVYSGENPAYLDISCLSILNQLNVKHLLVDLPSVDKENDGGEVAFHHGFWGVPDSPKMDKTITEMIYVPNSVKDGEYLLNLQVAPFENDASPSRPVIYELK